MDLALAHFNLGPPPSAVPPSLPSCASPGTQVGCEPEGTCAAGASGSGPHGDPASEAEEHKVINAHAQAVPSPAGASALSPAPATPAGTLPSDIVHVFVHGYRWDAWFTTRQVGGPVVRQEWSVRTLLGRPFYREATLLGLGLLARLSITSWLCFRWTISHAWSNSHPLN